MECEGQILSYTDKRNNKSATQQVSFWGWGCGSVDCLLSVNGALGSLLSTSKITIDTYICVLYIYNVCTYIYNKHMHGASKYMKQ